MGFRIADCRSRTARAARAGSCKGILCACLAATGAALLFLMGLSMSAPALAEGGDALPDRVLYYDAKYDVTFAQQIDDVVRYFSLQGFRLLDTPALADWLRRKTQAGACSGSVVLQVSDVTPTAIVEPWDRSSLLYQFCHKGGRYIQPSGGALYAFEGENDIAVSRQGHETPDKVRYLTAIFGIRYVYALPGKGRRLTEAGKAWGLTDGPWVRRLWEGYPPEGMTTCLVTSDDGKAAFMWQKSVNPAYPHSGLIGMCTTLSTEETLLEALYKACVFDGKPVTAVPKVAWRKPVEEPAFAVRFSMKRGPVERRAYQRGEAIPARVEVFGSAYRGEAALLRLRGPAGETVWEARVPAGARRRLEVSRQIETADLCCGEYALECAVAGREPARERVWICPARRRNPLPWFLYKDRRENVHRETLALRFLREHALNVCMADLHQIAPAAAGPAHAERLGRYLDLILRANLTANARADALPLYADPAKPEDLVVLPNGSTKMHGTRPAIGWRALREGHLPAYREALRTMASLLRASGSPAVEPFFYVNDDGSMRGEYDFSEATLADFEKRTGLSRKALPQLAHVDMGPYGNKSLFMPDVPPGVVEDNHPWLQYLRYHAGNYAQVNQAAMEALQTGWPGCLAGDLGCMSGPVYISRGYYPPIYARPFNAASFYEYAHFPHHYPFSIEAARMGQRDKPTSVVTSAAWLAWGRVYQRGVAYRILAEAPQYVAFWSLDAGRPEQRALEAESYETLADVGGRVAQVAEFLKRARPRRARGALLFPLEQLAFNARDQHSGNYYVRAALENFARAGGHLELLTSEEVLEGKAADYDVVFLNGIQWIQRGVRDGLERYIRGGGVVVADAQTTVPVEGALKAEGVFAAADADTGRTACVDLCRKYVSAHLRPVAAAGGDGNTVVRVVDVEGTSLAWVLDVETEEEMNALRAAQSSDWNLGVPGYLKAREASRPRARKPIRVRAGTTAYDLWAHRPVALATAGAGWLAGRVETQYHGGTPVVLLRDPIRGLRLDSQEPQARRGSTAHFLFRLVSDGGAPVRGLVPAEVKVTRPDGSDAWEYGDSTLIRGGVLLVSLDLARNEPAGRWRLSVRELCSGKTAEAAVAVK